MAQRAITGEWLHRDLPLAAVERTRELSGPGQIAATIDPELRDLKAADGLRVLEDWGTFIYAARDDGPIVQAGIVVPPTAYDDASTRLTCPGFTTYPHGYVFDDVKLWGPDKANPKTGKPEVNRPDPLVIVQDLWAWMQSQADSDLGMSVVGDLKSTVRIGSYEEPYRLRWWETPDIGEELDNLAEFTPFDYVEEHAWSPTDVDHTDVDHRLRLGWPRLGKGRSDLRFAVGENVVIALTADTIQDYANSVMGFGNGEGRTMKRSTVTVHDGRLRRTRVLTDKTITSLARLRDRTARMLAQMQPGLDITQVAIIDHPNARISDINLGDDITVQGEIPAYGDVHERVRVLSITQGDVDETAILGVQRTSAFLYSTPSNPHDIPDEVPSS